jgi:hypothetical protein
MAASDGRWRVREGVAMGFQRIAEHDFSVVQHIFNEWLGEATLLERRAIVAALAHPDLLTCPDRASACLAITDRILGDLLRLPRAERRHEGFRVLKKGLQYAISVFVAAAPAEGFAFIRRWATVDDGDIRSILKANLQKARLTKTHSAEVASALAVLERKAPQR